MRVPKNQSQFNLKHLLHICMTQMSMLGTKAPETSATRLPFTEYPPSIYHLHFISMNMPILLSASDPGSRWYIDLENWFLKGPLEVYVKRSRHHILSPEGISGGMEQMKQIGNLHDLIKQQENTNSPLSNHHQNTESHDSYIPTRSPHDPNSTTPYTFPIKGLSPGNLTRRETSYGNIASIWPSERPHPDHNTSKFTTLHDSKSLLSSFSPFPSRSPEEKITFPILYSHHQDEGKDTILDYYYHNNNTSFNYLSFYYRHLYYQGIFETSHIASDSAKFDIIHQNCENHSIGAAKVTTSSAATASIYLHFPKFTQLEKYYLTVIIMNALSRFLGITTTPDKPTEDEPIRTSETHPLEISLLPDEVLCKQLKFPQGARLGMHMCPGRNKKIWKRSLKQDLERLKEHGIHCIVSLVRAVELEGMQLGAVEYFDHLKKHGFESYHYPVRDKWLPSNASELCLTVQWIRDKLQNGKNVTLHCNGGKGRAATVTACLLVSCGISGSDAIDIVQDARSGSLRNPLQQIYVRRFKGMWEKYLKMKEEGAFLNSVDLINEENEQPDSPEEFLHETFDDLERAEQVSDEDRKILRAGMKEEVENMKKDASKFVKYLKNDNEDSSAADDTASMNSEQNSVEPPPGGMIVEASSEKNGQKEEELLDLSEDGTQKRDSVELLGKKSTFTEAKSPLRQRPSARSSPPKDKQSSPTNA